MQFVTSTAHTLLFSTFFYYYSFQLQATQETTTSNTQISSDAQEKTLSSRYLVDQIRSFLSLREIVSSTRVNQLFYDTSNPLMWRCSQSMSTRSLTWYARDTRRVSNLRNLNLRIETTAFVHDSLASSMQSAQRQLSYTQSLSDMRSLSCLSLNFRDTTIPVTIARSIFSSLPILNELRSLSIDLRNISFGQRGVFRDLMIEIFTDNLLELNQLQHLRINLARANINAETLVKLIQAISKLSELRSLELNLDENPELQTTSSELFGEMIASLPNLTRLNLSLAQVRLSEESLRHFIHVLRDNTNLCSLSLNIAESILRNTLAGTLGDSLETMTSLQTLRLGLSRINKVIKKSEKYQLYLDIHLYLELVEDTQGVLFRVRMKGSLRAV